MARRKKKFKLDGGMDLNSGQAKSISDGLDKVSFGSITKVMKVTVMKTAPNLSAKDWGFLKVGMLIRALAVFENQLALAPSKLNWEHAPNGLRIVVYGLRNLVLGLRLGSQA